MMKTYQILISFDESFRLFHNAVKDSETAPYPELYRFLTYVGFTALIHEVLTAATMYPTSKVECQNSVNDLSYSFYHVVGKYRLSHLDQERLTKLIDRIGCDVIRSLHQQSFYLGLEALDLDHEPTTSVSIKHITNRTFHIVFQEDEYSFIHDQSLDHLSSGVLQ